MPTAAELVRSDPLRNFREQFVIDDDWIYLDGNSLGRLPKKTADLCHEVVEQQWGRALITSWNQHWLDLPQRLGNKIAKIIGAKPNEVILADSTSVNLFKLVVAAIRAHPERQVIVTDDLNFPSDVYILQSAIELAGPQYELRMIKSADGLTIPMQSIEAALDSDVALLTLSHVCFRSGFLHDMEKITQLAHAKNIPVLWDLSHSVGAIPMSVQQSQVDFAVGCTYKYLNGGPGSPAFLYVREDWQNRLQDPIGGWFGQRRPFDFELEYQPVDGINRFLTGTPQILSLAAIEPGLDLVLDAGMQPIREKSIGLADFFLQRFSENLASLGYALKSPAHANERGSHIAIGHPEGLRITKALIDRYKVLPDFRYPDNIRLGFAPLYTTYAEVDHAVEALKNIVVEKQFENYSSDVPSVT